jgi:hypothetical protein
MAKKYGCEQKNIIEYFLKEELEDGVIGVYEGELQSVFEFKFYIKWKCGLSCFDGYNWWKNGKIMMWGNEKLKSMKLDNKYYIEDDWDTMELRKVYVFDKKRDVISKKETKEFKMIEIKLCVWEKGEQKTSLNKKRGFNYSRNQKRKKLDMKDEIKQLKEENKLLKEGINELNKKTKLIKKIFN